MPFKPYSFTAGLLACLACLSTNAQPTSLSQAKPGLWEFQQHIQSAGKPSLPAEIAALAAQIDQLPPAMRSLVEQQLATIGLGIGAGGALRICVSPAQIKQGLIQSGQTEGSCTFSQVQHRGNKVSGQVTCQQPQGKGEFRGVLHSPEQFSATAALDGPQGQLELSAEGKYVSHDCGALARRR